MIEKQKSRYEQRDNEVEECTICLCQFEQGDSIVSLKCGEDHHQEIAVLPSMRASVDDLNGIKTDKERSLAEEDEVNFETQKGHESTKKLPIAELKSRHVFHFRCLKEWIKRDSSCPLCKS